MVALASSELAARAPARVRGAGLSDWIGAVVGIAVLLLVWWLASATLFQSSHAIPTPGKTLSLFFEGSYWHYFSANFTPTIKDALWGFLWGNLLSVAFAVIALLVPWLREVVNQLAIVTYCLPPVAIGPIIILVAGHDHPHAAPIVLAALAPFFTTVIGALLGLRAASRTSLDLVAAYGGGALKQLYKVRVIAALPNLFAGLRIAAPAAFLGAVLAEFVGGGGENSVGKWLLSEQRNEDTAGLWWSALCCAAVAGIGYIVVGLIANLVTTLVNGTDLTARSVLKGTHPTGVQA